LPSAAEAVIEKQGFYRSAEPLRRPKATAKMRFYANCKAASFQTVFQLSDCGKLVVPQFELVRHDRKTK
jgi:hypothetical protein